MTIDHNKHLTITYNYLNLPQSIAVTNKETVTYVYDAAGVKLQKKTIEGSSTTVTTYLGSSGIYTYNDGTLATQKSNSNYYVSQTAAITNSALADDDPEKYYDPETVPFIVVSMNKDDQLSEIGLKLNGKALIQVLDDNGKVIKTVEVSVRDLGPSGQGTTLELSPAAARLISPQGKEPYRLDLSQNSNSRVYQNAAKRHKAKYGQPFQNKKYLCAWRWW